MQIQKKGWIWRASSSGPETVSGDKGTKKMVDWVDLIHLIIIRFWKMKRSRLSRSWMKPSNYWQSPVLRFPPLWPPPRIWWKWKKMTSRNPLSPFHCKRHNRHLLLLHHHYCPLIVMGKSCLLKWHSLYLTRGILWVWAMWSRRWRALIIPSIDWDWNP